MSRLFNRMKTVYGYYTNKHVLGAYPNLIGMELTNHCNLECVMCPQPNQTRDLGLMDVEFFKSTVDEIKGKTEFMYMYGMGESLLHPKFFEMTEYASKAGIKTCLSTNLSFLTEERSYKLLDSGISFIALALDGASKDIYESIRVGGDFSKNLEQVKILLQLKNKLKAKSYIEIQFIQMEKNETQTNLVSTLFSKEERSAIDIFRVKPVYDYPHFSEEPIEHKNPCYFPWSTMTVTWDGKVSMCCFDYNADVLMGDLNQRSVYEVWNSKEMADFRDKQKKLDYSSMSICDSCSIPEKNYFSNTTILASGVLGFGTMRKGLPLFEKLFVRD
jgi:radical SAM protein with 4Fe4S-binding SPASM domain